MNQLPFNPDEFDLFHIGISGGKDSTATLLWYIYESGLPQDRLIASFCDTGNEDRFTYEYIKMLSERVYPIETIKPERDFWELAEWKGLFPSRKARFCTQFLKVIPTREHVLELLKTGKEILLMNGVRRGESPERRDLPEYDFDSGYGTFVYRPLIDWEIAHIWDIHQRYLDLGPIIEMVETDPDLDSEKREELIARIRKTGIPRNPLYDIGASRVGCFPCINSSKGEIRGMVKYRPQRIDFIRDKEYSTGKLSTFFARTTVPEAHRSREIVTKAGEVMKVCTIDDIVLWSQTAYGGKQYDFDPDIINTDSPMACGLNGECE